jgi:Na+/proline symporter
MAAFLRAFRAIYLGAFFNIVVIATVSLALIKISAVMLGWPAERTLIIAALVVVLYSTLGGLKSILVTDFFQFGIAMVGVIGAAIIIVRMPEVGGLAELVTHEAVEGKLHLIPDLKNSDLFITLFLLPLAVQWWSVWYPGAEPGGGGYVAQRMLSAKSENGARAATLIFNILHYALRPWPWIIVGLASLVVFPDLQSLQDAFPNVDKQFIKDDFAYPAMLSYLPTGFLGLVVASLIAAFMSTTASQINWGSSYIVNDFYRRFLNPGASERKLVLVGRISTVALMTLAVLLALLLTNALQAFHILLQIGAGTGLIYILRWFWWRINAYTEITGMIVSFLVALYLEVFHVKIGFQALESTPKLLIGVGITTASWLLVTFLTPPENKETLRNFFRLVYPGGPGWKKVLQDAEEENVSLVSEEKTAWDVPTGILCMLLGSFAVVSTLFATGYILYGKYIEATLFVIIDIVLIYLLSRTWRKLKTY